MLSSLNQVKRKKEYSWLKKYSLNTFSQEKCGRGIHIFHLSKSSYATVSCKGKNSHFYLSKSNQNILKIPKLEVLMYM